MVPPLDSYDSNSSVLSETDLKDIFFFSWMLNRSAYISSSCLSLLEISFGRSFERAKGLLTLLYSSSFGSAGTVLVMACEVCGMTLL